MAQGAFRPHSISAVVEPGEIAMSWLLISANHLQSAAKLI
jgi:hypothetical protein